MSYLSLISEGHIPEHIWNSEEWKKQQEAGARRREKIAAKREPERQAKAAGATAPQMPQMPLTSQLQHAARGAVLENNPFVQAFQENTPGHFNPLDVRSESQKKFDQAQQIKKWESAGKNLKLTDGTDLGNVSVKDATKIANNPKTGAQLDGMKEKRLSEYRKLQQNNTQSRTTVLHPNIDMETSALTTDFNKQALQGVADTVNQIGGSGAYNIDDAKKIMLDAIRKYVPQYQEKSNIPLTNAAVEALEEVMVENGIPGYYVGLLMNDEEAAKVADKKRAEDHYFTSKALQGFLQPGYAMTEIQSLIEGGGIHRNIGVGSQGASKDDYETYKNMEPWEKMRQGVMQGYEDMGQAIAAEEEGMNGGKKFAGDLLETTVAQWPAMLAGLGGSGASLGANFVASAGSNARQAESEGASPRRAAVFGGIMGGVDTATEKMFGISTPWMEGGLDKKIEQTIAKNIKNKVGRGVAQWAAGAVGEGAEEGISAAIQPWVKHFVYDKDAPIDYSEVPGSFALGAASGAMMGAVPSAINTVTGAQTTVETEQTGDKFWQLVKERVQEEKRRNERRKQAQTETNTQTAEPDGRTESSAPTGDTNAQSAVDNNADTQSTGTAEMNKTTGGVKVGEVTTIYSPYDGETPVQSTEQPSRTITVSEEAVNRAKSATEQAANNRDGVSIRSALRRIYEQWFDASGGTKHITVKNTTFGNESYVVDVNKNAVSKLISDPHLSVEKLSLLDNLENVVENGKYVGSGNYEQKGKKVKDTIRFDYFETPVTINGKNYVAAFDVEVFPNTNQYRTHKVIEKMDLMELPSADTGPVPAADGSSFPSADVGPVPTANGNSSSPMDSISQNGENVNTNSAESGTTEQISTADTDTGSASFMGENATLTKEEKGAILRYKGGSSYAFNEGLRDGTVSPEQEQHKQTLNAALQKMPRYEGTVYRNIGFLYEDDFSSFILENSGDTTTYAAFTSSSKSPEGYVVDMPYQVHMEIKSYDGRDLTGIGTDTESEVLFPTDTPFKIYRSWQDGNVFNMVLEEVTDNGNSNGNDGRTVVGSYGNTETNGTDGKRMEAVETLDSIQGRSGVATGVLERTSRGDIQGDSVGTAGNRGESGGEARDTAYDTGQHVSGHTLLNENADRWGSGRERWEAEGGTATKDIKSLSEIVKFIEDRFGLPIGTGNIGQRTARGVYKRKAETVRTRVANALPTVAHELGHHLDKQFNLSSANSVKEVMDTLPASMKKSYSAAELPGEAVAEFVREYLSDSVKAAETYPNFYQDFKNRVGRDAKTAKTVLELADMVHGYMSADAESRLDKAIGTQFKKENPTLKDMAGSAYEKLFDDAYVAKQIDSYIERQTGKKLTPEEKFYVRILNERGSSTIVKSVIEDKLVNTKGEVVGDSLREVLEGLNKEDMAAFNRYLVVKHAQTWLTPDENGQTKRVFADDTMNNLEYVQEQTAKMEQQHPEFAETAKRLYEYQQNLMKTWLVDTGMMSEKTMTDLTEKYPYYVPLKRKIGKRSGSGTNGFVNQKAPIKGAHGSGLEIIDPIESIVSTTDQFIRAAKRNEVMQTLVKSYDEVEGLGQFIEEIGKSEVDKRKTTVSVENQKNRLKKSIDEYVRQFDSKDSVSIDKIIDEILGDKVSRYTPVTNSDKRIVTVLQNGEPRYFKINDVDLYNLVTSNNVYEVNPIIKATYVVSKMFKMLTTGENPLFGATNAVKDFQTLAVNAPDSALDVIRRMPKSVVDVVKNSDDYKMYKRLGGGYNTPISGNETNFKRTVRELYDTHPNLTKRILTHLAHPIETIGDVVNFTEVAPRLSTFKSVLDKTGSAQGAIFEANDVTVNFQKRGRYTQGIETLQPYFNAKMQSLDKAVRQYKKAPVKTLLRQAAMLIPTIISMALLFRDDDAKEDYQRLSSYQKNRNFNFWVGDGKFVKIPKGETYTALNSLLERSFERFFFENEDAFYGMGDYLWDAFVPSFDVGNIPIFGNFYDLRANKDFMNRPIVSANLEELQKADQYDDSTSWIAKQAGTLTRNLPEAMQLSPKQVDYVINKNTGFIGKVNSALTAKEKDFTLGMKSKFLADSLFSSDMANRFYEQKEKIDKSYNSAMLTDNADGETAYRHSQYAEASSVLSQYNKLIRAETNQAKRRQLKRDQLDFLKMFEEREEPAIYTELYNQTKNESVFPQIAAVTVRYKNDTYTLTKQERQQYQEIMDAKALDLVTALSETSGFAALDAEEKVEKIQAAQAYAQAVARNEVLQDKYPGKEITYFKEVIANKNKYYSIWDEVEPNDAEKQARGKAIGQVSSVVNALSKKSKLTPKVISDITAYTDEIEKRSANDVDKELVRLGVLKEENTDTENGDIDVATGYMSMFSFTESGQKYAINVRYEDLPAIMREIEDETYKQMQKLINNRYRSQKKKTYGELLPYTDADADQKIKWINEVRSDVKNEFKEKYKKKYGTSKVPNKLKAVK